MKRIIKTIKVIHPEAGELTKRVQEIYQLIDGEWEIYNRIAYYGQKEDGEYFDIY